MINEWFQHAVLKPLSDLWRLGLKIGYDPSQPAISRSRVIMLNGVLILIALSVISFSIIYFFIGYKYYYGPLYIIPFILLVLRLNHQKQFNLARNTYVVSSLLVISYWCYEGRGNGNEYTLIGLATTSTLLFERKLSIYLSNALCGFLFLMIKYYDASVPFEPDPTINYNLVPWIILINSGAIASFQMAFFRDLIRHYDGKLLTKFNELNAAMEKQLRTDEELRASNEQLHQLTNQLEITVKKKSTELQSYVSAINVNIYSCINDLHGHFTMVNEPLLAVSGYTREEIIGKHFNVFNSGYQGVNEFHKRRQLLLTGKTWIGEIKCQKKDGSFFWYDGVVIPIYNEADQIDCFLSLGIPITERKLNEQIKEQTRTMLESIAFRTSHDIRGPIARIEGLSRLALNDLILEEEFMMIAQKLIVSTDELKKATGDLMKFVNDHRESIETAKGTNELVTT